MAYAGVEQVAKALNISARRVQQLVKDGLPRISAGEYELGACMLWYIRHLQRALEARASGPEGSMTSLMAERTRQARASTERMDMENMKARGEVILVSAMQQQLLRAYAATTQALCVIPQRVTADDATRASIDAEVRSALTQLADNLEALGGRRPSMGSGGRRRKAKAKTHAVAVGGSVPGAAGGRSGAGPVAI
jgi:phage terminase Nu1 subunit (DNA packaging protein)